MTMTMTVAGKQIHLIADFKDHVDAGLQRDGAVVSVEPESNGNELEIAVPYEAIAVA